MTVSHFLLTIGINRISGILGSLGSGTHGSRRDQPGDKGWMATRKMHVHDVLLVFTGWSCNK
jgi:hypothetical protein